MGRWSAAALLAAAPGVASCNPYDVLIHQHYDQASFSNKVDVLWIIDNSNSMAPDQANVQANFSEFINAMTTPEEDDGGPSSFDELGDVIEIYQDYLLDRSKYLDYQMGFTTTQQGSCGTGNDQQTDAECLLHGVSGKLRPLSEGESDPYFLFPGDEQLESHFDQMVDMGTKGDTTEYGLDVAALTACLAICPPGWTEDVERDDAGQVTRRECVADDGSGAPATWSDLDPDHPWYWFCRGDSTEFTRIPDPDVGWNLGFLREDATLVVVVVTDEGDSTPNLDPDVSDCLAENPDNEECDCELRQYLDFFESLERKTVFAVVGPSEECNEQNSSLCMIHFYEEAALETGGLWAPINVRVGDICDDTDFATVLGDIGSLIGNLTAEWPLSRVPNCPSVDDCDIQVFVNGDEVPRDTDHQDGWDYIAESQSVRFYGDAVPDYNAQVDIYYLPEEAGGRPLPF